MKCVEGNIFDLANNQVNSMIIAPYSDSKIFSSRFTRYLTSVVSKDIGSGLKGYFRHRSNIVLSGRFTHYKLWKVENFLRESIHLAEYIHAISSLRWDRPHIFLPPYLVSKHFGTNMPYADRITVKSLSQALTRIEEQYGNTFEFNLVLPKRKEHEQATT